MDTMEAFFEAYWAWEMARYHLIGLGVIFLVIAGVFRRPGIAAGVLGAGLYVSLAVFWTRTYADYGFNMDEALGVLLGAGILIAILFYFAIFVRS